MLQKLNVKNVILITSAEVEFSKGLNVLTGETGAGKSILVDCLMLLFGARYDKSLLRYGAAEGYVEGVFSLNNQASFIMAEMGIGSDSAEISKKHDLNKSHFSDNAKSQDEPLDFGIAIIKRRFTAEGKSDIKINGQTATVGMLKKLMASLIDIYGQHDFQKLYELGGELSQIDYYGRHNQRELLDTLGKKCQKYRETANSIKNLGDAGQREREIDYLNYQITEINSANIYETEEDELVAMRRRVLNHEKITDSLREAAEILSNTNIARAIFALKKIESFGQDADKYIQRMDSCLIELDDINSSIKSELRDAEYGSEEIEKIEKRLSLIRGITKKYGNYQKMTAYLKEAGMRLEILINGGELYEQLAKQKDGLLKEIYNLSLELSQKRRTVADEFSYKINAELHELGMQNAELKVNFATFPEFSDCEKFVSPIGMDDIQFNLRTNAGQPFMPLLKIISGGEMSRFMLAIKAVSGDADKIPTLIFDEIDNGISGRVGQEVAKKLAEIALNSQILCVTHLPQIAAMADRHLMVKKENDADDTVTHIENLNREGMIREIARLSGGVGISESSEISAAEIKDWCNKFKSSVKTIKN